MSTVTAALLDYCYCCKIDLHNGCFSGYYYDCLKSVRIWSFSGPYFPAFGLPYSVRMQENKDQKTPNTDTFHAVYRI